MRLNYRGKHLGRGGGRRIAASPACGLVPRNDTEDRETPRKGLSEEAGELISRAEAAARDLDAATRAMKAVCKEAGA